MAVKKKLTPWLPASVFPARPGDYLTGEKPGVFRNWDGETWSFHWMPSEQTHAVDAKQHRWNVGRGVQWRGLAEQPK